MLIGLGLESKDAYQAALQTGDAVQIAAAQQAVMQQYAANPYTQVGSNFNPGVSTSDVVTAAAVVALPALLAYVGAL